MTCLGTRAAAADGTTAPAAAAEGATGLTAAYERCRALHARFGRSYYLATLLLPAWKRRHVHALYGFARYADEIVDSFTMNGDRAGALDGLATRVAAALAGERSDDPVLPAFAHTVRSFGIGHGEVAAFLRSMRADLTVTRYATYDDLLGYMEGSAAVIGTMMLPILEPLPGREAAAREPARQLGLAFQLTNFLRDVAEDLARGRVYLPTADLDRFGVTEAALRGARTPPEARRLLAFEAGRARDHYARALEGVALLTPSSRPCVRAAYELYGGILTGIERGGYEVLARRARVPRRRRLAIFTRHLVAARSAGRRERRVTVEVP
ncbi:phytoene/squalene synthase family protein [Nonomuraea rhodomycinica]|uniref:Phytoene/squalene synthase family protein n=1 Tax=Nonomuraea rhodomycinica TaxID=1712872 RepID=A0A7Y6IR14_9ACTN|nr:phytoene/squalene synthase family protein [Nonomuraea rhodomycinica]NUW42792.1 phytoene/squalene synthase family protein [Nonomuraea rhodomycinica]